MARDRFSINPDTPKQPDEEEEGTTRRKVIIGLGAGAAAAGLYGVGKLIGGSESGAKKTKPAENEEEDGSDLPPREIVEDPHIYESGDEIKTPLGTITTKGWKVMMDDVTTSFLAWQGGSGENYYVFKFKNASGDTWQIFNTAKEPKLVFPAGTKSMESEHDANQYKGFYIDPKAADPIISIEVLEFPGERASLESELLADENQLKKIRKAHRRQASHSYRYKLKLKGYASPEEKNSKNPRMFAEGRVPEGELRNLGALHELFCKFRPVAPLYIYGEGKNDPYSKGETRAEKTRHFDPLYTRVVLANQDFTDPSFPGQGQQVATHEMSHGILHGSQLEGAQFEAYGKLRDAYSEMMKVANENANGPEKEPCLSVLREYSYYKNHPQNPEDADTLPAGHPWSNTDELFASSVSVFRYYAKDFIKKFKALDPESKKLTAEAGKRVMNFLHSMNSDPATLKRLIPHIEEIELALAN
jgi:hypothetical protein